MSKKNKKKSSVKAISEEELDMQNQSVENTTEQEDVIEPIPEEDNATNEVEAPTEEEVNEAPTTSLDEPTQPSNFVENEITETPSTEEDVSDYPLTEEKPNEEEALDDKATNFIDEYASLEEDSTNSSDLKIENEDASVESSTKSKKDKKKKNKKAKAPTSPDKKKKKIIMISVLSALLVVAIVLSITLPIYFHFKGKVMINSPEDFNNVSKGDHYVLNKDIVVEGDLDLSSLGNYSIDLNGHTLTVNGNLKYAGDAEMTINIGNTKKKEYIPGGILMISGNFIFETPHANINLLSATQAVSASFGAKNVAIESLTTSSNIDINANEVLVNGAIQTDPTAAINVHNSTMLVNGVVNSTINGSNIKLTVNPTISVDKITLDELSDAIIYGAIKTSITGGNKVAMLAGHSCGEYNNIKNLALYRLDAKDYTIKGCERVVYVDKLETPVAFQIDERADGKIVAVSAKVPFATSYKFTIDDQEIISEESFLDISDIMISGGPGNHVITVTPIGNFVFDTFETNEDNIQYVDGDTAKTEFAYKIKLSLPENLSVTTADNGDINLTFNTVAYASGYEIIINGNSFTVSAEKDARVQTVNISSYVEAVGTYSIKVKAYSEVAEIEPSLEALTSFTKFAKLAPVTGAIANIDNGTLKVSYEIPENGTSYIIYAENEAGERIELGRTSLTEFSIEETVVEGYTKVVVVAQGQGYYQTSDEVVVDITRQ